MCVCIYIHTFLKLKESEMQVSTFKENLIATLGNLYIFKVIMNLNACIGQKKKKRDKKKAGEKVM